MTDSGPVGSPVPDIFAGGGELGALMRAMAWSNTALGEPQAWPQSLKTVIRIMLTSRSAMWMGWGDELSFFYNDACRRTLGSKHPWALGRPAREVWKEIWPAIGPRIDNVRQRGEATYDEGLLLFLERHGHLEETYHTFSCSPLPDDLGKIGGVLGVVTEETDRVVGRIAAPVEQSVRELQSRASGKLELARVRRQAEEELRRLNETLETRVAAEINRRMKVEEAFRQDQKMEAIGQLTGGVAHDFNNLLQVILGNLDALHRGVADREVPSADLQRLAEAAIRGAERAAILTQRLLAFSRRQPLEPKSIDVNQLVTGMSDRLRRTLGESIAVEVVPAGGLWRAYVDPNQLESALLNLAVNARDAMPNGGKLTIVTANNHLDDRYAAPHEEVIPGQYVGIAVSDTGVGMAKDVVARAFDPFFTTKDVGQGTGLGLSQVYGFVKQTGGHVKIDSEPGKGTVVRLYLPRHTGRQDIDQGEAQEPPWLPTGSRSEIVLVVEDDEEVRASTVDMLTELGYGVLAAPEGRTALRIIGDRPDIRLLFTDMGLPGGVNGRHLADEAHRRRPNLRILFTTGYARNAFVHEGRLDPGIELIAKPFTFAALAVKVRHVLSSGN